ncbi:MAG: hypothetical protein QXL17_06695 [Candidatus Thermoplasmatota archaeon]
MARGRCISCGFDFEEGVYLMKNKKDYICIFCLKNHYHFSITELFDQQQKRILEDVLDREGCLQLFSDTL